MSNQGLLVRIAEDARISIEDAARALSAAFQGLLEISCPTSFESKDVVVDIVITPLPPPHARRRQSTLLREHGDLVAFIAEGADISIESAGAALGVITQAIVEGGQQAGLRAYYEFEPD